MKLENKVSVVTGAGSGMGKAIAVRYLKEGAKVAASDIKKQASKSLSPSLVTFPSTSLSSSETYQTVSRLKQLLISLSSSSAVLTFL